LYLSSVGPGAWVYARAYKLILETLAD